jgi:hypothetical protein
MLMQTGELIEDGRFADVRGAGEKDNGHVKA